MDIAGMVSAFGYLGVFFASLIGSASIVFPLPSFAVVIAAGSQLDPLWVGIVSGIGAAAGELTGYGAGYGIYHLKKKLGKGRKEKKKERKWAKTLNKWFRKDFGFAIVFLFAVSPLPDDIIGIYCGAIRYDVRKFFVAMLIGKIILGIALAYGGLLGFELLELLWKK